MFLMIHSVSWGSRWLIWEPLARWHMEIPKHPCDQATRTKIENFSHVLSAASFHILSALFAWRILGRKEWLGSIEGWGDATSMDVIEGDFKFYYLLYAARYMSDMVSLYFEHRRSVRGSLSFLNAAALGFFFFTVSCLSDCCRIQWPMPFTMLRP